MITFQCPHCQKENKNPPVELNGKSIRFHCNFCSQDVDYNNIYIKPLITTEIKSNTSTEKIFVMFPDLETEWNAIQTLSPDSPEHDSFIEKCFKNNALTEATAAYRELSLRNDVDTSRRIRQLTILAQMSMLSSVEENKRKKTNWLYIFFMIIIALFFLWILIMKF